MQQRDYQSVYNKPNLKSKVFATSEAIAHAHVDVNVTGGTIKTLWKLLSQHKKVLLI